MPQKQRKISEIERQIREDYLYQRYEKRFFQLVELKFILKWLQTKDAVDEMGAENVQKDILLHSKNVATLKKELDYIKQSL